jgi:hypothetical protein
MKFTELHKSCRQFTRDINGVDPLCVPAGQNRPWEPADSCGRRALLSVLRSWGCRQLACRDDVLAEASLRRWWGEWGALFEELAVVSLDAASQDQKSALGEAYFSLRHKECSHQRTTGAVITKTFGPTGAAKALYAIRPKLCPLWDTSVRRHLGLDDSADSYVLLADRAVADLTEAALGAHSRIADLPTRVGMPDASPTRLVDIHYWIRSRANQG